MTEYIATFHTHLSAMRTQRTLTKRGVAARLSPVPRYLSASCGTCVIYSAEEAHLDCMDRDVERVVQRIGAEDAFCELLVRA
ncbi:MAG TPA: hypothetical protein DCY10_00585 [Clostridiales bacterium]|jgi:hypothetical protein|nr:hypothetical protein [Clostridiales bacterium]